MTVKEFVKNLHQTIKDNKDAFRAIYAEGELDEEGDLEIKQDIVTIPPINLKSEPRREDSIFNGLSESKLNKLKKEISLQLARILEKKLLSFFNQSLEQQQSIQESYFYKPDPELNLFITKLKTTHEKIVALMVLDPVYVGLLSKSHQRARANCLSYLIYPDFKEQWIGETRSGSGSEDDGSLSRSSPDSGAEDEDKDSEDDEEEEKSHGSRRSSQEQDNNGEKSDEKSDGSEKDESREEREDDDEETGGQKPHEKKKKQQAEDSRRLSQKEEKESALSKTEISIEPATIQVNENFGGLLEKPGKNPGRSGNNDNRLDFLLMSDWNGDTTQKLQISISDRPSLLLMQSMYHADRLPDMRRSLHTASQNFIETFIADFLISKSDVQPYGIADEKDFDELKGMWRFNFPYCSSLLFSLSANPINEIRIFDHILTFATCDTTNPKILNVFNEHFGTALSPQESQKNLNRFMREISEFLKRYKAMTPNGKNCIDLTNFDTLVASVEKIHGIAPFKKRLAQVHSDISRCPQNFLDGFLSKALSNGSLTNETVNYVVDVLRIKDIGEILNPYNADIALASDAVEKGIALLANADPNSVSYLKLTAGISDCLENEDIFLKFLDVIRSNNTLDTIEKIASEAAQFVSLLKAALNNPTDTSNALTHGTNLSRNRQVLKFRYTVHFFAQQCRNLMEQLKNPKFTPTQKDYQLCTHLVREMSVILEIKAVKLLFLHLAQSFELLESVRKESPQIESRLKDLECLFDIILEVYSIFKAHVELQDKCQDIKFILDRNQESKAKPKVKFERVATKSDEDFNEGVDTKIPGFDRSFSQMKESGRVKIDELFLRLSQKAKQTIQMIKTPKALLNRPIEEEDYDSYDETRDILDLSDVRDLSIYKEYPWLLSFEAKRNLLNSDILVERLATGNENGDDSRNYDDEEFSKLIILKLFLLNYINRNEGQKDTYCS